MNGYNTRIMKLKKISPTAQRLASLLAIAALFVYAAAARILQGNSIERLKNEPLHLQVGVLQQSLATSCGEAVITMVHNHAHPEETVSEAEVIEYAAAQGYFTEGVPPFTSPANMVKIARHYSGEVASGSVSSSQQALSLLIRRLRAGQPVVIDVLTRFDDPESEAHFVVVTGISINPARADAIVIHYNDPLTGTQESAEWAGPQGVWNAWQNNGDPGGRGWWMVVPAG